MIKKCLIIGLCLALVGCSSYRKVNMPIVAPCAVPVLPKSPELPIYKLTASSQPDEVIKAYVASVRALQSNDRLIRKAVGEK